MQEFSITWPEADEIYLALQAAGEDDYADAIDEAMSPNAREVKYGHRGDGLDDFKPESGYADIDWKSVTLEHLEAMIAALRADLSVREHVDRTALAKKLETFMEVEA